ncbi:MAG: outer membrane protein assembly factor BamD [Lentimicrobiaceae bacterium]|nr:outer membrane protein assembly factor BamD [Lentimicrobiaceae bacterium]
MFRKPVFIIVAAALLLLVSCSRYQKLLKSSDNNQKYERALVYYEKGDYYRSMQLLEQLQSIFNGTDKSEKISYYYAYCYYQQGDFMSASYYFKRFAKNFPSSKFAEECAYMSAYCNYLDSPDYNLDQTNTLEALKEMQLFINTYPNSERVQQCNDLMDKLRAKLERKAFEIAQLYLKMSDYKAAIISYKNVLKEYPDTPHKEQILFDLLKANYKYAVNSITSKQKERYQAAMDAYNIFASAFPESSQMSQAKSMYKNSQKALEIQ